MNRNSTESYEYDDCKSIEEQENKKRRESKSHLDFSKTIKNRQNKLKEDDIVISTRDIAAILGISYEQIRKYINQNKPMNYRDIVISICAILRMTQGDTSEAIEMFDRLIPFSDYCERDNIISDYLNGNALTTKPMNVAMETRKCKQVVKEINDILSSEDQPTLYFGEHKLKEKKDGNFICVYKKIIINEDDFMSQYYFSDLNARYSPRYIRVNSKMLLKTKDNKKYILLTYSGEDNCYVQEITEDNTFFRKYIEYSDDLKLDAYYTELKGLYNQKMTEQKACLNDTKNYGTRLGTRIINEKLHVFIETFNFKTPEISEYYFLEFSGGNYIFTIANKSLFLEKLLGDIEYKKDYKSNEFSILTQCHSVYEIEKTLNEKQKGTGYIDKVRINEFNRMKKSIESFVTQLREKKEFIQDVDRFNGEGDEICRYYGVEKEFKCIYEDIADIVVAGEKTALIKLAENDEVSIDIGDLYDAYKLGINDINELCRIKQHKKSINQLLYD